MAPSPPLPSAKNGATGPPLWHRDASATGEGGDGEPAGRKGQSPSAPWEVGASPPRHLGAGIQVARPAGSAAGGEVNNSVDKGIMVRLADRPWWTWP